MRRARFTEHEIIAVLKSVEAGRIVKDICCKAAITTGRQNMAGWEPLISKRSKILRTGIVV